MRIFVCQIYCILLCCVYLNIFICIESMKTSTKSNFLSLYRTANRAKVTCKHAINTKKSDASTSLVSFEFSLGFIPLISILFVQVLPLLLALPLQSNFFIYTLIFVFVNFSIFTITTQEKQKKWKCT